MAESAGQDSKWYQLVRAAVPPGTWVALVMDDDPPRIVATGDDEESTRMAARTSGYSDAVLLYIS